MLNQNKLPAIKAKEIAPRTKISTYPEPFFSKMNGREKRQVGDFFGLKNFGVNLTELKPGSQSALFHQHSLQDEFIFILEGCPTLITEGREDLLSPGMCAGFRAGGSPHHLVNKTNEDVLYLEIGDRTAGDEVIYPNDDLIAVLGPDGLWKYSRKDATSYNK